jgi:hypothetical protein
MKIIRIGDWYDLSPLVLTWMKWLGNFSPTYDGTLKGYKLDSDDGEGYKEYLDSGELRELAQSCIVVADWLDALPDEQEADDVK